MVIREDIPGTVVTIVGRDVPTGATHTAQDIVRQEKFPSLARLIRDTITTNK